MKYFEMFTGIAGFSKGIEQAYGNSDQYESAKPEQTNSKSGRFGIADERGNGVLSANGAAFRNGNGRGQECLNASDSARSGVSPTASSNSDTPKSTTTVTQPGLFPASCPTSTFSAVDFLARLSRLLESDKGLMTPEALCFLRSHGFYHTKDPDIFYSKTLKVFALTNREKLCRRYLGFSPNSITEWKSCFLIQNTTGFPKTGNESSLSDILQNDVSEKYFLSDAAVENLMKYNERQESSGNGFRWAPKTANEHMPALRVAGAGKDDTVIHPSK